MRLALFFFLLGSSSFHYAEAAEIGGRVVVHVDGGTGNKPAHDAVVFLEAVPNGSAFDQAKARLDSNPQMASKDKQFTPMVLPILAGSHVEFPNDDRILHNVFSLSKLKPFDLGLYAKGVKKGVPFSKAGLIKVYCNIHEAMVGYILVLENPFFAKTDESGAFKIAGVPEGKYKLVAWHRHSSNTSAKDVILGGSKDIAVTGGKNTMVDFELVEDNRGTKHKNKWGKEYQDKY